MTITNSQLKNLSKVFKRSGRTFQTVARESGLSNIPDHVTELSREQAKQCLSHFSGYLMTPKEKQ